MSWWAFWVYGLYPGQRSLACLPHTSKICVGVSPSHKKKKRTCSFDSRCWTIHSCDGECEWSFTQMTFFVLSSDQFRVNPASCFTSAGLKLQFTWAQIRTTAIENALMDNLYALQGRILFLNIWITVLVQVLFYSSLLTRPTTFEQHYTHSGCKG